MDNKSLNNTLILNTLKRQHLLVTNTSNLNVIKDLIGVQSQYIRNAKYAIAIRTSKSIDEIERNEIVKIWSLRGTLNLHLLSDIAPLVDILQDEWFKRWGKYLSHQIDIDNRKKLHEITYNLILKGFNSRNSLKDECLRLDMDRQLIELSFSSWGGILKDLNYLGKIMFCKYDTHDFSINTISSYKEEKSIYILNLMKRYFKAYGPATLNDFCYWSGINVCTAKKWIKEIIHELKSIEVGNGIIYYYTYENLIDDISKLPQFLFLAGFDPIMVAYKNKDRFIDGLYLKEVFLRNGFIKNILIRYGKTIGVWKINGHILEINSFINLSSIEKSAIEDYAIKNPFLKFDKISISY